MRDREMDGFEDLERTLRDGLAVTPDPAARSRSKARILEATLPSHAPRRPLRRRGLVAPLAAAFVVISATGAAAVPASAHALPGDALYGVRMATESIRIAVARDEASIRLAIARARTVDLERAIGKGRHEAVDELSRRFFEQLATLRTLSANDGADLITKIEAQQARLDAIADRIADRIGEKARADEVLRRIRRHDHRGKGSRHVDRQDDEREDRRNGRSGRDDDREGARDGNDTNDRRGRDDSSSPSGRSSGSSTDGREDDDRRDSSGSGSGDRSDDSDDDVDDDGDDD
jgi:hypothetical protein